MPIKKAAKKWLRQSKKRRLRNIKVKEGLKEIIKQVRALIEGKKLDPVDSVEVPLAMTMADKCVGLIATIYPQLDEKVGKRILEL